MKIINLLLVVLGNNSILTLALHCSSFLRGGGGAFEWSNCSTATKCQWLKAAIRLECTNIPKTMVQRAFDGNVHHMRYQMKLLLGSMVFCLPL